MHALVLIALSCILMIWTGALHRLKPRPRLYEFRIPYHPVKTFFKVLGGIIATSFCIGIIFITLLLFFFGPNRP